MSELSSIGHLMSRIPPIPYLLAWVARRPDGFRILNAASGLKAIYPSFDAARRACLKDRKRKLATDAPDLTAELFALSVRRRPSDYPVLFWLSQISSQMPLRVFDYGGGAGQSFFQYVESLPQRRFAEWMVMDLPHVIDQARAMHRGKFADVLSFSASLSGAHRFSVFHAAGAFHYWEDSLQQLDQQTGGLPYHVIINRSPMRATGESFLAVQKGERWAIPCKVWSFPELVTEFADLGYRLVDRWEATEKQMKFPLLPHFDVPYCGAYFARDSSTDG